MAGRRTESDLEGSGLCAEAPLLPETRDVAWWEGLALRRGSIPTGSPPQGRLSTSVTESREPAAGGSLLGAGSGLFEVVPGPGAQSHQRGSAVENGQRATGRVWPGGQRPGGL